MSQDAGNPNIDERLQPFANIDFSTVSPESKRAFSALASMMERPQTGTTPADYRAPNVTLKLLSPEVDNNENLIDFNNDNASMNGNASADEWAAWYAARLNYAKAHPEYAPHLEADGRGRTLPPQVLNEILADARRIHTSIQGALDNDERADQLLHRRAPIEVGDPVTRRRN